MVETTDVVALAPRPRSQFVATGFAVAAGSMMMAGAIGWYMARRHQVASPGLHGNWIPEGVAIPSPQLDYALLTLLLSVVTAHWALYASRRSDRGHTWLAIATTIFLGLAFINMVMYSLNRMDLEIGSGEWANLAFAVTGLSLALAVVGLFYIGLMALRSLGGNMGRNGSAPLGAAVFFWDFVALAWAVTWYAVYVVK
jgi:heme/copper-type cytochrome/quinol oxidase subunit 3